MSRWITTMVCLTSLCLASPLLKNHLTGCYTMPLILTTLLSTPISALPGPLSHPTAVEQGEEGPSQGVAFNGPSPVLRGVPPPMLVTASPAPFPAPPPAPSPLPPPAQFLAFSAPSPAPGASTQTVPAVPSNFFGLSNLDEVKAQASFQMKYGKLEATGLKNVDIPFANVALLYFIRQLLFHDRQYKQFIGEAQNLQPLFTYTSVLFKLLRSPQAFITKHYNSSLKIKTQYRESQTLTQSHNLSKDNDIVDNSRNVTAPAPTSYYPPKAAVNKPPNPDDTTASSPSSGSKHSAKSIIFAEQHSVLSSGACLLSLAVLFMENAPQGKYFFKVWCGTEEVNANAAVSYMRRKNNGIDRA
ncbi:hypothetical protein EV702DRAFT_1043815 [Suillus placidus]|uniref:Uncharacterized protein n=1 Tax=Suillus placidus TaxID=48579 RepID=A0A9P7A087_9AGAM|nr:hypothetical protein EV702DRAFT_1043815 [Suillus placidus]